MFSNVVRTQIIDDFRSDSMEARIGNEIETIRFGQFEKIYTRAKLPENVLGSVSRTSDPMASLV